jgi:hypothetical protein
MVTRRVTSGYGDELPVPAIGLNGSHAGVNGPLGHFARPKSGCH